MVKANYIYRVSQEECARLREGVPYVKVYRYNPKHLCTKLNGMPILRGDAEISSSLRVKISFRYPCPIVMKFDFFRLF